MLEAKERLTEQQQTLLETTLNQLEASKGDVKELQNTVERLTQQLKEAGTKLPTRTQETQTDEPTVRTQIINTHDHGKVRFGINPEQQSVQIIRFGKDEGSNITSLRISNCRNLIQIDLTNLPNLQKISLRNSK